MHAQVHASTSKLPVGEGNGQLQAGAPPPLQLSEKAAGKARARQHDDEHVEAASNKPLPPQTWQQIIKSGVAGGIAACLAKTSVAPLDRVKILFQTGSQPFEKYSGSWTGVFKAMNQIYREGGMRALLQGHSMTLLRIYPYASIKFMAYEALHRSLMPTPDKVTGPRLFAAGALAGVTSVFFTYPLELIRVRLAYDRALPVSQLQGHSTLVYSILKIYHEGDPPPRSAHIIGIPLQPPVPSPSHTLGNLQANGQTLPSSSFSSPPKPYFKNPSKAVVVASSLFARFPVLKFYRGFVVSIIGMIPYAGTSFLVWGYLKKKTPLEKGKNKHSTRLNLTYGAIAGAAAQTASYPFEVVRRRMQVGGLLRPDRFFGFWETVSFIYNRNGLRGFYVGLSIGYLKVIPLTAISFASWEAIKKILKV